MNSKYRCYEELCNLHTFEERFEYLKVGGIIGELTFGVDRVFNQMFYHSSNWRNIRNRIITRDMGCDLGIKGMEIMNGIIVIVHHMNPITIEDIQNNSERLLDPNNLITTTDATHKAIHYGTLSSLYYKPIERKLGDTKLW